MSSVEVAASRRGHAAESSAGLRQALGPLAAPLFFLLLGSLWLSAARAGLVLWQWPRLHDVPELWRLFALGARLDLASMCYLLVLPALVQLLLPRGRLRRGLAAALLTGAVLLILAMELLTPPFLAQFDARPDRVFYEYLIYPREVFGMLWRSYPLPIVALPAALLFAGARGFEHRPLNASDAAFSDNRLANQLALNSAYSAAYAAYSERHERDVARLYGDMPWPEVVARVRKYSNVPDAAFATPVLPTLHRQAAAPALPRPRNLVIILEESLGAGHVGKLGGLPLTPNLDALAEQGLWFTRMYATGTRTARGMEAVVAGFPPTPAAPVLKLPRAQTDFFTLGALLQRHGYATEFIYGGVANFDNMRAFYLNNGFARVIEQKDFVAPGFLGSWGVSDEDWVAKAHETFLAHGDAPFFAVMLSTSNHEPFEFPAGRIEPYEHPLATRYNAMKYADHALGRFFELARGADYFANTVFAVVADHEARVYGAEQLPLRYFRVPALILGPGIAPRTVDAPASQIDLGPTLLGLLGIETEHPMIGRNLLALPPDDAGRALMQFERAHGFRAGDRLVVHTPDRPAATFTVTAGDALVRAADDAELTRDALAHVLWAARAYRERRYRLPEPPQLSAAP